MSKAGKLAIPGAGGPAGRRKSVAMPLSPSELKSEPSVPELSEEEALKQGIQPLFLTSATCKIFGISIGDNVSKENPMILLKKEAILQDIQNRLSISDFSPVKLQVSTYPQDDLELYYDFEFKHGQNFYLITSVQAKEILSKQRQTSATPVTKPSRPAKWVSLGSDAEINAEKAVPTRPKLTVQLARRRKDFAGETSLQDFEEEVLDFNSHNLETPDIIKIEKSVGIQSIDKGKDNATQTMWYRHISSSTQCEPQLFKEEDVQELLESEALASSLAKLIENLESVLYYNQYVDIFTDDYAKLGDEDLVVEENSSSGLLEFQSFTDTTHTKDTTIAAIDWYPAQRGVIAHSCVKRLGLDEKIELGPPIQPRSAMVLIWSFLDPINPQLFLEAPDDINCIQFNPKYPHLIAGGCVNGQIVLWNIQEYAKVLQADKKSGTESKSVSKKSQETPIVKWICASPVELSHKGPVTDLTWIESPLEHGSGFHELEGDGIYQQLVTCSLDGWVAFWDTRSKTYKDLRSNAKSGEAFGKAFLKVPINSADNSVDFSLTKLSLRPMLSDEKNAKKHFSKFFCGSEEGDVVYADWAGDRDKGDDKQSHVDAAVNVHFGCVSDIKRSVFFPDILISVGAWSFVLWKEDGKMMFPILRYHCSQSQLISCSWSPTRPAVFYITRADGKLEIWDLLDNYYEPMCVQGVSSTGLASLSIVLYTGKGHSKNQYLATGDDDGTLHILEIARNFCKPSKAEKSIMQTFFDMEFQRLKYINERKSIHSKPSLEQSSINASLESNTTAATQQSAAPVDPVQQFDEGFRTLEDDLLQTLRIN